jgi:uncharacterized protein (TIGR00299 family) protein
MSRVAYFDCFSGASGDMIAGALLDAGLDLGTLRRELGSLGLPPGAFNLTSRAVNRAGFAATKFDVEIAEQLLQRSLAEVMAIIQDSGLPATDRERISAVFTALGEAEARVHGEPIEQVHLHEVGAVDAIVDVAAAVVGLRLLGVEDVYVSPLPLGRGQVRGRHGVLPVPAPATLELIARAGAPILEGEDPVGELVTPTGAAILTTLGSFRRPAMRVRQTGSGAGGRDPEGRPNILRVWLGEAETPLRRMRVIETNIDDMAPELLAFTQERLFAAGAADVWFTPVQMKKNRPGVMLSLICAEALESELAGILLRETSTLGVRVREVARYEAEREVVRFDSSLGPAAVKVKRLPGEPASVSPEFEDCRRIALERNLPLADVYATVAQEATAFINR